MKLHFQTYPEDLELSELGSQELGSQELGARIPIIIIPGLFGSTSNWRSFARHLGATLPVITIDQRNHGRSPHADSHSYADMVSDLLAFCDQHGLQKVHLCGHSMGGKVAMLFTLQHPSRVEKLLVLDIAPVKYTHSHAPLLEKLMQLDLAKLKSRNEAEKMLQHAIPDSATRLFLLQSLTGSAGNYYWRLNLPVLHKYAEQVTDFPSLQQSVDHKTLFVAGELSDYILPEHHARILQLFPNTDFETVAGAGHWLHAEQPSRVLALVEEFVQK